MFWHESETNFRTDLLGRLQPPEKVRAKIRLTLVPLLACFFFACLDERKHK
jgi:hypothetical protein